MIIILDKTKLNKHGITKKIEDWKYSDFLIDHKTFQIASAVIYTDGNKMILAKGRHDLEDFNVGEVYAFEHFSILIYQICEEFLGMSMFKPGDRTKKRI